MKPARKKFELAVNFSHFTPAAVGLRRRLWQGRVAQTSKSPVAQVSKPAAALKLPTRSSFPPPADLGVGDTVGLDTCATRDIRYSVRRRCGHGHESDMMSSCADKSLHPPTRCPKRIVAAFTKLKLLVVIGMLGLLAMVSFPLVGKAKVETRRNQCLSNLKQLAVAWQSYSAAHNAEVVSNHALQETRARRSNWVNNVLSWGTVSAVLIECGDPV